MQTIAQWLEERGMDRGLKEGRKEGLKEGHKEGQHDLLLRLLRKRFGELPAGVVARIDAADEPSIARWAEQLLTAGTLDAVFATQ